MGSVSEPVSVPSVARGPHTGCGLSGPRIALQREARENRQVIGECRGPWETAQIGTQTGSHPAPRVSPDPAGV